jgi:hypothetical protein
MDPDMSDAAPGDEGALTVFYWYDDEPADEDEQWAAAMYDDYEPTEEP